ERQDEKDPVKLHQQRRAAKYLDICRGGGTQDRQVRKLQKTKEKRQHNGDKRCKNGLLYSHPRPAKKARAIGRDEFEIGQAKSSGLTSGARGPDDAGPAEISGSGKSTRWSCPRARSR